MKPLTKPQLIITKLQLIKRAREQYGEIFFCGKSQTWHECFTEDDGELHFWFNDKDGNTHLISEPYENEE